MGRALMIPGMVGKNIGRWLAGEDGGLPKTVSKYGRPRRRSSSATRSSRSLFGKDVEKIPLGAVGIYSATEKIRVGLQQIMAGARKWAVPHISRRDLASLTEECANVTGIPYIMDAYRDEAVEIIKGIRPAIARAD